MKIVCGGSYSYYSNKLGPRGCCPSCGKNVSLTKDSRIRKHQVEEVWPVAWPDAWAESVRQFITAEECECDCFRCANGEHCGRCE